MLSFHQCHPLHCWVWLVIVMAADSSAVGLCCSVFIGSSAGGHLHGFQFGTILNRAVMNIFVHDFWSA